MLKMWFPIILGISLLWKFFLLLWKVFWKWYDFPMQHIFLSHVVDLSTPITNDFPNVTHVFDTPGCQRFTIVWLEVLFFWQGNVIFSRPFLGRQSGLSYFCRISLVQQVTLRFQWRKWTSSGPERHSSSCLLCTGVGFSSSQRGVDKAGVVASGLGVVSTPYMSSTGPHS